LYFGIKLPIYIFNEPAHDVNVIQRDLMLFW